MPSLPPINPQKTPGQAAQLDMSPPQSSETEETQRNLADLDVNQASDRSKKTKIFLSTTVVLLILLSLPIATYLVQQRQELRKEAATNVVPTPSPSPTPTPPN